MVWNPCPEIKENKYPDECEMSSDNAYIGSQTIQERIYYPCRKE
jgi:hypothetical protein